MATITRIDILHSTIIHLASLIIITYLVGTRKLIPNSGKYFVLAHSIYCGVKWISIDGVMVKPSCVLLKETGDFPAFLQVQNIFVTCTDVFMQGP